MENVSIAEQEIMQSTSSLSTLPSERHVSLSLNEKVHVYELSPDASLHLVIHTSLFFLAEWPTEGIL